MTPYLIIGALVSSIALSVGAFFYGQHVEYAELMAKQAAANEQHIKTVRDLEAKNAKLTAEASKVAAEHQDHIQTITRTIIRKVPIYVTRETNARFPLALGFVRLYDASGLGVDVSALPGPTGQPNDSAAPVSTSDAAVIVADNNGTCNADRSQLADLQAWLKQAQSNSNAGVSP